MSSKSIKILVVEDEYITQKLICSNLIELGYQVVGTAMSYDEAVELLKNENIEFALLDITLKGDKTGIDIANYINEKLNIPHVFLTAYSDQETLSNAIKTNPYGYLVKPFEKANLYSAIEIAFQNFNNRKSERSKDEFIFVKNQDVFQKVFFSEICFIESQKNYLLINTVDKVYRHRSTISDFKACLPSNFMQIHKGFLINIEKVENFNASSVFVNSKWLPISKMYKQLFLDRILKNKH